MERKKILEHTCFQKEHPLSPIKCRCRKYISTVQAAKLITEGSAQFVIKSYKSLAVEEVCPICSDQEKLRASCGFCKATGKVTVNKKLPVYGDDVIITVGEKGKRLASTIKKKTPRSPTIESNHILRGLGIHGNGQVAAHDRWDEYEMLTLKERIRLLVINPSLIEFEQAWHQWETDTKQPFPLPLRTEPIDDAKTGSGRRYDYGRSV